MKVAIAGYGIEGRANLLYWLGLGADVTILDAKEISEVPEGVSVVSGDSAFEDLSDYDLVVRTASLRPDKLSSAKKVWSATNEFFEKCPAPIIGVTGTKGKGTTSSLIASILRAAGKTVHLVGNIGVAALEVLPSIRPDDIVVFEMSSFQLWDLKKSPHIAVVLMVEPDHQDVHLDMDEYLLAKSNISARQHAGDTVVYHPSNKLTERIAEVGQGRKVRYETHESGACYVRENTFFVQDQQICSTNNLQLVGQHNIENACAAITAAWVITQDAVAISNGLSSFEGLPHRMRLVCEIGGIKYYDDNYSSAPGAAVAAMRSFTEPEIIIMGGYDKLVGFEVLAEAVAKQQNIKRILLMGQTCSKIAIALDRVGCSQIYEKFEGSSLQEIVKRAHGIAEQGDVVVMSPACASFDMFKNFSDRGDRFIKIVEELQDE